MSLATRALFSVLIMVVAICAIVFSVAGTINYWKAWIYLIIFTVASLLITIYLIKNDPELLERRLRGGPTAEKRSSQRVIMTATSIAFLGLLVIPALDQRYGWTNVSLLVVVGGELLVAVGFYFIFRVYKVNTYTSATIEVADNQRVIDTGPYALVRHPMYISAFMYLGGTPLALGSYWGLVPFFVVVPFLLWRIIDEETMLVQELEGYAEYQQRVRYRLLPGIW